MLRSLVGSEMCIRDSPLAWRPDGFCRRHQAADAGADPTACLGEVGRQRAACILGAVTELVVTAYQAGERLDVVYSAVGMLERVSHVSPFRRLTCEALNTCNLDALLTLPTEIPERHHDQVGLLCLTLLLDPPFKTIFTRRFVGQYETFITRMMATATAPSASKFVDRISCQLFHDSELCLELAQPGSTAGEGGLVRLLLEIAGNLLVSGTAVHPTGPANMRQVDNTSMMVNKQLFGRVVTDLKSVLVHQPVLEYCLSDDGLTGKLLQVVGITQGLEPQVRKFGQHVEYESNAWASAFVIQHEVMSLVCTITNGLAALCQQHRVLPQLLLNTLSSLYLAIQQWSEGSSLDAELQPVRTRMAFVSPHIPLHRAAGLLLKLACADHLSLDKDQSVGTLLGPSLASQIAEHPIRTLVFFAQVQAGMWRRNGQSVQRQAIYHRNRFWHDTGLDMDLFLIQVASVAMGCTGKLLDQIVSGFDLEPLLGRGQPLQSLQSEAVELIPLLLSTLVQIVSDRSHSGMSDYERTKHEVVQWLGVAGRTHSALAECLADRLASDEVLDQILAEVATQQPGQPAILFQLASPFRDRIDPFFSHLSQAEKETAQQNLSQSRRAALLPRHCPALSCSAAHLLCSPSTHDLLLRVLHGLARGLDGFSPGALLPALTLLGFMIQAETSFLDLEQASTAHWSKTAEVTLSDGFTVTCLLYTSPSPRDS
eukprot:TRINITY_DN18820_c0_g1_i3.p1 TRINITY_DN18820_c0_g1~~TRINITY_DN18820_c0_g1_i3.p1  ORF type:complete len:711 (+),score=159.53 TRINITY_DN18820_c0_g1_i3:157-2289(+)